MSFKHPICNCLYFDDARWVLIRTMFGVKNKNTGYGSTSQTGVLRPSRSYLVGEKTLVAAGNMSPGFHDFWNSGESICCYIRLIAFEI